MQVFPKTTSVNLFTWLCEPGLGSLFVYSSVRQNRGAVAASMRVGVRAQGSASLEAHAGAGTSGTFVCLAGSCRQAPSSWD